MSIGLIISISAYLIIACCCGYWVFRDQRTDETKAIVKIALTVGLAIVWPFYLLLRIVGDILVARSLRKSRK